MLSRNAMDLGYTCAYFGSTGGVDLNVLVKPDADLDGTFRAYCLDECEIINVNGWHFAWEAMNDEAEQAA